MKNSTEIIGIGIDIVEVARIKHAVENKKRFLGRIYSDKEVKLSERGKFRFEELAGRFEIVDPRQLRRLGCLKLSNISFLYAHRCGAFQAFSEGRRLVQVRFCRMSGMTDDD